MEDFLEGLFACPGDKEGGFPGTPISLCWSYRRRTLFADPGAKKEDFLKG